MSQAAMRLVVGTTAAMVLSLAACAARTAPATQATPRAFDLAASDPKAIAIADQVIAASGGEAAWRKARELSWQQAVVVDGKLVDLVEHDWDRWNGRHRFRRYDRGGSMSIVMHDLYDGTGAAYVVDKDGNEADAVARERAPMMKEATSRWTTDAYRLVLPFKLKDPGVHLRYLEERAEEGASQPKWDVLELTFDAGVGLSPGDVYELAVNKETHMIELVGVVPEGKSEDYLIGYRLEGWQNVAGMKLASRWVNLGFKSDATTTLEAPEAWRELVPIPELRVPATGEVLLLRAIVVSDDPDDRRYVPQVR